MQRDRFKRMIPIQRGSFVALAFASQVSLFVTLPRHTAAHGTARARHELSSYPDPDRLGRTGVLHSPWQRGSDGPRTRNYEPLRAEKGHCTGVGTACRDERGAERNVCRRTMQTIRRRKGFELFWVARSTWSSQTNVACALSVVVVRCESGRRGERQHAVLLFDGVCLLCNGFVHFVIDRDPPAHFRFATLQGAAGTRLPCAAAWPADGPQHRRADRSAGRAHAFDGRSARAEVLQIPVVALLRVHPRSFRVAKPVLRCDRRQPATRVAFSSRKDEDAVRVEYQRQRCENACWIERLADVWRRRRKRPISKAMAASVHDAGYRVTTAPRAPETLNVQGT
eukprot:1230789-Prymnesium_polylepis.1